MKPFLRKLDSPFWSGTAHLSLRELKEQFGRMAVVVKTVNLEDIGEDKRYKSAKRRLYIR